MVPVFVSWAGYFFAGLMGLCFIASLLSRNDTVRAGFIVLFAAWVFTLFGSGILNLRASVGVEFVLSIFVIAAFFKLAEGIEYREFFGAWTNGVLMVEATVLLAHVSKFWLTDLAYVWIVNSLFAIELLIVIIAGLARALDHRTSIH